MKKKWLRNTAVALVLTTAILPVQITTTGVTLGERVAAATMLPEQNAGNAGIETYTVDNGGQTTYVTRVTPQAGSGGNLHQSLTHPLRNTAMVSAPVPSDEVQNLYLYNDGAHGFLNGYLSWDGATDASNLTGYNLYFLNDQNQRVGQMIQNISIGQNLHFNNNFYDLPIPAGATKIGVIAATDTGEVQDMASVRIWSQDNLPTGYSFEDTDMKQGEIGGTITWQAPKDESSIVGYDVYVVGDDFSQGTYLGRVAKGSPYQMNVLAGTPLKSGEYSVTALPVAADGEVNTSSWTWTGVLDATPPTVVTRPTLDLPVIGGMMFRDNDNTTGALDGQVDRIYPFTNLSNIDYYSAYFMDADGNKIAKIGDVWNVGYYQFRFHASQIPAGATYLGVFSETVAGESTNYTKTFLWDAPYNVNDLHFTDTDAQAGSLGGDVTWSAAPNQAQVASYELRYVDDTWDQVGDTLAVIPATGSKYSFHIPAGTVPFGAARIVMREIAPTGDLSLNIANVNLNDMSGPLVPSVAPTAGNITVTNNPLGTDDTVQVKGLHDGDIVSVYNARTGGDLLGTSNEVANGAGTATVPITELSPKAGNVYVTVTSAGKGESSRVAKTYTGEPTDALAPEQISVHNNRSASDGVTVTNLKSGDVVKVYGDETSTRPLGTSTAVASGKSSASVTISQLGTGAGHVFVTVTSTGQTESARTSKSFDAEPPAPSVAPVARNFAIINHPEGTDDSVSVSGLKAGDVIKLYASDKTKLLGTSDAVKEEETSVTMTVPQVGVKAGTVYATLTSTGFSESRQTPVTFGGEPTQLLSSDQIKVVNNRLVSDQVIVTGLTKGDVIKVYANENSTTPLVKSSAVTGTKGPQQVTLSIRQLGTSAGSVYVTITSAGQTESDRISKSFDAEPPAPTATPSVKNFAITNNIAGTPDQVQVKNLKTGDVVKIYSADKVTLLATSEAVQEDQTTATLSIDQLGLLKGTVYATVTSTGFGQSAQTAISYAAEKTAVLNQQQITIFNNRIGTYDKVAVTGLKKGDVIKVYNLSGRLLGSSTVATGKTDATISISQLGTTAGSVYVTITSAGQLESDRQLVDYVAELSKAPLASQIVVVNNPLGTNDTVTVSGLKAGDIVNVYDAQTDGKLLGTSDPVATRKTTATVLLEQLGLDAGTVYVTVTNVNQLESVRVAKAYLAEATL